MEKRNFPPPDLPFAAGVICGCASGYGINLFFLPLILAGSFLLGKRTAFFTALGMAAGCIALAVNTCFEQASLRELPERSSYLQLVCRSCDSTVSFVPALPRPRNFTARILKINGKQLSRDIRILIQTKNLDKLPRFGETFAAEGCLLLTDQETFYGRYLRNRNLSGSLEAEKIRSLSPPEGFIYRLCCLRDKLLGRILNGIGSDSVKVIISTMFFGVSAGFDNAMKQIYLDTGTLHLFSISGMHLAVITAFLLFPALLLPYKIRYYLVGFIILCYALSTGANPPVMRAAAVILFWCAGKALLLRKSSLELLASAAALLFLLSPKMVYDTGAQYSFFITALLIFAVRNLNRLKSESGLFMSAVPNNPHKAAWQKREDIKWRFISIPVICLTAFVAGLGISAAKQIPVLPGSIFMNLLLTLLVPPLFLLTGVRLLLGDLLVPGIMEKAFQLLENICFEGSHRIVPAGLAVKNEYEALFFCVFLLLAAASPRKWMRLSGAAAAAGIFLLWFIRPCFLPPQMIFISQDAARPPVIAIAEPRERLGFLVNASGYDMAAGAVRFLRGSGIFRPDALGLTPEKGSADALAFAAAAGPPERICLPVPLQPYLQRKLAGMKLKNIVFSKKSEEFIKIFKENSSYCLEYFNPGSKLSFRIKWNDTPEGRLLSVNGSPARRIAWGNRQEILYYGF